MSRTMRTYFYAVLGGIGGLVGWQVSNMLGLSFGPNLFVSEMLVGALVGLCVGLFIGITEGAMTLNIVQAAKSGLVGGLLGMVAGAIGLPKSSMLRSGSGTAVLTLCLLAREGYGARRGRWRPAPPPAPAWRPPGGGAGGRSWPSGPASPGAPGSGRRGPARRRAVPGGPRSA